MIGERSASLEVDPWSATGLDDRPPKAVLDDFGVALETALASGFAYVKGRRSLERKVGPWTLAVHLETSRYNRAGVCVVCDLVAYVSYARLGEWRLEHGSPFSDIGDRATYVRFERLFYKRGIFRWDLVFRDARSDMVHHTVLATHGLAVPWFDLFLTLDANPRRLLQLDIPHLPITFAFELWLALSTNGDGHEFVSALRSRKPDFWARMEKAERMAAGEPFHFKKTLKGLGFWP